LRLLEEQERRHQEELKVLRDELAAGRESGEPEDAEEVFSRLERQFGEQLDPR
jgi:Arc/MetJ-type ribon-helix-helix transcriptional regulator